MQKGGAPASTNKNFQDDELIERMIEEEGEKLERSPTARRSQREKWLNRKASSSGKLNRDRVNVYQNQANTDNVVCPHCRAKGDIF
jgi:hypothetical protein